MSNKPLKLENLKNLNDSVSKNVQGKALPLRQVPTTISQANTTTGQNSNNSTKK